MLVSSSTQLSAADISVRENSRVTKGPGAGALRAAAAPVRGAADGPLAAAPAAGTSARAAATVTAVSSAARLERNLPACLLTRSVFPLMVPTS
jgi:hypothetical protein